MLQLPVPYRSQWDADANRYRPDCGPTCLAMILNYLGVDLTPNELYDVTTYGQPDRYTTVGELRQAARAGGVEFPFQAYGTNRRDALEKLQDNLENGRPIIALVSYRQWKAHTGINYDGGHFVVVTGYDEDQISFHDPLFSGARREQGAHFTLSTDEFCAGWSGFEPGENPNWGFIAPGTDGEVGEPDGEAGQPVPGISPEVRRRIEAMAIFEGKPAPDWSDAEEVEAWQARLGDWGAAYDEYTVQAGDTLSGLAQRFYARAGLWPLIQAYNGLSGELLLVGQRLRIPSVEAAEMIPAPGGLAKGIPEETEEAFDYNTLAEFSRGIGYESDRGQG